MAYRSNPFEVEEEDDKFEDISTSPEIVNIKQQKDLHEQRMIDSSYRSLRIINETQGIATETAEELHKQRQQLERTDKNLDKIHGDLKQTDRNITSLKSIWGTMSTWFKKPITNNTEEANGSVSQSVNAIKQDNQVLKDNVRNIDQATNLSWEGNTDNIRNPPSAANDIVDKNLDQMLSGLQMLKQQGLNLGNEIDDHNILIDKIQRKTENTDDKLEGQNKRMNQILRK